MSIFFTFLFLCANDCVHSLKCIHPSEWLPYEHVHLLKPEHGLQMCGSNMKVLIVRGVE